MQRQKIIIYSAVAFGIIIISIGLLITPTIWKQSALMTDEQIASAEEASFYEDYSETLKIYSKLDDEQIPVDTLQIEVKKLNEKAVLNANRHQGRIYIEDTPNEYISFDVVVEEEDSPEMAINYVYHDIIGQDEYTIHLSGENTYQHFNGRLTSEFGSKKDAIMDHLLYR